MDYGIELGMNFIDTGEDYEDGKSEELLSQVISTKEIVIIDQNLSHQIMDMKML